MDHPVRALPLNKHYQGVRLAQAHHDHKIYGLHRSLHRKGKVQSSSLKLRRTSLSIKPPGERSPMTRCANLPPVTSYGFLPPSWFG